MRVPTLGRSSGTPIRQRKSNQPTPLDLGDSSAAMLSSHWTFGIHMRGAFPSNTASGHAIGRCPRKDLERARVSRHTAHESTAATMVWMWPGFSRRSWEGTVRAV